MAWVRRTAGYHIIRNTRVGRAEGLLGFGLPIIPPDSFVDKERGHERTPHRFTLHPIARAYVITGHPIRGFSGNEFNPPVSK